MAFVADRVARSAVSLQNSLRGADIARQMHFSEAVAHGIEYLDEHWNGMGLPKRVSGQDIPINAQIALMSQVADVFHTAKDTEAAMREIGHRSGTWFNPALVDIFNLVASRRSFWEGLDAADLQERIFDLEPANYIRQADEDYLDDIAAAFAKVIDSKSPFTSGHSERVTIFADLIAEQMGYTAMQRRWLKRAALLHDIGKLGVSNSVLDKPGKLTDDEYDQIKLHPVYSAKILANISVFSDIAPVAGGHHERLDGNGYRLGLKGEEIDLDTRIVTVADIFDALTADRPYRTAMPVSKAIKIMAEEFKEAIDPVCFDALKNALEKIDRNQAA